MKNNLNPIVVKLVRLMRKSDLRLRFDELYKKIEITKTFIPICFIFLFCLVIGAQEVLPKVIGGKLERLENFSSEYVTPRNVDVWLPDNYSTSKKYAVLYMHDGQMLFDENTTWNNTAWDVDDVASELFKTGTVKEFIVVGIWNLSDERHSDYYPRKPFTYLSKNDRDAVSTQLAGAGIISTQRFIPQSDNYLKFIVSELKPYIDSNYSVLANRENTFIAGSSMGALISLYALCEYPKIFGGVACLSTHWIGTLMPPPNPIPNSFVKYLNLNLPKSKHYKIYFDCGNKTLDRFYPEIQKKVDNLMLVKGYGNNWKTYFFPGENHSEVAWKKRLHIPLKFLFGNNGANEN